MPVYSLPQLSFGFPNIYQPTKCTFNGIHYVIGFARQVLKAMRRKRTFGEITWKRIVGNKNITCLTILAPALGDFAVIRVVIAWSMPWLTSFAWAYSTCDERKPRIKKMKNSSPGFEPGTSAYEPNALSVELLELINIDHLKVSAYTYYLSVLLIVISTAW